VSIARNGYQAIGHYRSPTHPPQLRNGSGDPIVIVDGREVPASVTSRGPISRKQVPQNNRGGRR
jgi:hypothetical protein